MVKLKRLYTIIPALGIIFNVLKATYLFFILQWLSFNIPGLNHASPKTNSYILGWSESSSGFFHKILLIWYFSQESNIYYTDLFPGEWSGIILISSHNIYCYLNYFEI